ncbi:protein CHUP1, chloroplastic [Fagus crenata]
MSHSTTPSRLRASPKAKSKDSPIPNPAPASSTRRPLLLTKPKPVDHSQKGNQVMDFKAMTRTATATGNRHVVEQFARPRHLRSSDPRNQDDPHGKSKDLIENLQSQLLALKAELDKAQSFNLDLLSQNKKLTEDLSAAQAKIAALNCRDQRESLGEYQSAKFRDIQRIIASKLEHSIGKKEPMNEVSTIQTPPPPPPPLALRPIPKVAALERKAPTPPCSSLPPPPPPLPPPRQSAGVATTQKAPALVEFYHSLKRQEGKKRDSPGSANHHKPAAISAHSSIVGEIQNRSSHLLAIRADIETKGDFINGLIHKVLAAAYTNIEDVLKFVDWLDTELSSLADERAVLRHFKWPERKADAMREAAIEYRDLKLLQSEISSYQDDTNIPCGAALKKIASLLDKSEQRIQRLIKLRNSVMKSYQEYKIPTEWMLDSGIVSKIKKASLNLAKMYMKRVTLELESIRNSDRESGQESLLLQGVQFAYRAHQFAGGLDSETLCAFEEIRQQVPQYIGGSRELLAAIPSS